MKAYPIYILSVFLAFFALSCIQHGQAPQYVSTLNFAAAYVYDDIQNQSCLPLLDSSIDTLHLAFSERNLAASSIAMATYEDEFSRRQDSDRRLQSMRTMAPKADVRVLVELRASFYSQLSGRYRWDVKAKISLLDAAGQVRLGDEFNLPAVLMFSHEKGDAAIDSVKEEIARRLGSTLDSYMRGRDAGVTSPVQESPKETQPVESSPPHETEAPSTDDGSPEAGDPLAKAVYFIMVDRFFNANKTNDKDSNLSDPNAWHGGDLAGVRERLDYLKDLGISAIWLSPIFLTAQSNFFGHGAFHAYWTYDLNSLEPRFGNERELVELAREAKKRGIGIILDFVVNHVGYGSPWVEERPHWFHKPITIENWDDPVELVTGQVHGLPDLNQSEPEVYDYLEKAAFKWLEIPNIVGYRLDAVKHVSVEFWSKLNNTLRAKYEDIVLLGEMFDGSPYKVTQTQKQGAFSHMFDFPLAFALRDVFCEGKSLGNLASVIDNDRIYEDPNSMVTFIDNHDMPRISSLCKQASDVQNALRALLALRGLPSIYYGTESGLVGEKEPDNRADMDFEHTPNFAIIREGLELRTKHPVLANGKTAVLYYDEGVLSIARENTKEQALVIINQTSREVSLSLAPGKWTQAYSGVSRSAMTKVAPKSVQILTRTKLGSLIENKKRKINFVVDENSGEFAIVGSSPEFGLWNPDNGIKLKAKQNISVVLPSQSVISYKLVRKKSDASWEWEQGSNREIFTSASSNHYVLKW
ncbi:MAG: alpha-amylase family glycosyl hydrolase [Bradymonadales bacterium]|jgi:glycosidase